MALVSTLVVLLFGGAILDGPGKRMLERAYGRAHPGSELRLGGLEYSSDAARLVVTAVSLESPGTKLDIERITLTGVRWARLLRRSLSPEALLAGADLDATRIEVEFRRSRYGIACGRLRASARDSLLLAEGFELRTLAGDEDFFAAREFRQTRYLLAVPEFRVLGLAYDEMLRGQAYRARSARFSRPVFDAYVSRDKPSNPVHSRRLMVHEMLAALTQPLQVDSVAVVDGAVSYRDRVIAGDAPGVLSFGDVGLSVAGLASRTGAGDTIRLRAQGALMGAGVLKIRMSMPVAEPDFSLSFSGSLGAMDATRLNEYLEVSVRTRLESCLVDDVAFAIEVDDGRAGGRLTASYRHLEIARLDEQTGESGGLKNSVVSFLANVFKIRSDNTADAQGAMKVGKVEYVRKTDDSFFYYLWRALKTGILDVVCY
ncbi:DUF748 domain-containing protein [bacterium]|nr:DUF748 domain-containing protein [bacterium]